VAFAGEDDARAAEPVLDALTEGHPSRVLSVVPVSDLPPSEIRASASGRCRKLRSGTVVCSETIELRTGTAPESVLPATVRGLLVADVPVVLWWRRPELARQGLLAALLPDVNRLIVDTSAAPDPEGAMRALAALSATPDWAGNAGDLAWVRLEPWREAIASAFDAPPMRRLLARVTALRIEGAQGAAAYLQAWLASRLGWSRAGAGWARPDGGMVEVSVSPDGLGPGEPRALELRADDADPPARITACRCGRDGGALRVDVETSGAPLPAVHRPPALDAAALLHGELQRDARDPLFEEVLGAVAGA